jgi:hypothetical protein
MGAKPLSETLLQLHIHLSTLLLLIPQALIHGSILICRNPSEILNWEDFVNLLGLSQGFGGGAPNELEIKCWRPAERQRVPCRRHGS